MNVLTGFLLSEHPIKQEEKEILKISLKQFDLRKSTGVFPYVDNFYCDFFSILKYWMLNVLNFKTKKVSQLDCALLIVSLKNLKQKLIVMSYQFHILQLQNFSYCFLLNCLKLSIVNNLIKNID